MYNNIKIIEDMNTEPGKISHNKNLIKNIIAYISPIELSKLSLVNKSFHKICLSFDQRWKDECYKIYLTQNNNHR